MSILAGNTRVCERVALMTASHRIPHAILLEGETGTGKHTLGNHIAAAAVCDGDCAPCGECRGCHLAQVGSHPDIKLITPEKKQLSVDEVRALRQDAFLVPALASLKVYIIEKADSMAAAAQNALLKILEEPPSGVVFILLATSAEGLLETVRSRCVTLSLVAPERDEAADYIASHNDFSALDIDRALEFSKNNIGEALEILRTGAKNSYSAVADKLLMGINGSTAYDMLFTLRSFERDRSTVTAILDELLYKISALLRESYYTHIREGLSREQLVTLYEITRELKARNENNVNLMLLFADLCNEYKSVIDN